MLIEQHGDRAAVDTTGRGVGPLGGDAVREAWIGRRGKNRALTRI